MTKSLKKLSGYKNLSKEEKERLLKVHGNREDLSYNLTGTSASISRKELKKAKEEAKELKDE